jgi:hypothetical protein
MNATSRCLSLLPPCAPAFHMGRCEETYPRCEEDYGREPEGDCRDGSVPRLPRFTEHARHTERSKPEHLLRPVIDCCQVPVRSDDK